MNIYISRVNAVRLMREANKSGLINRLLEAHYSGTTSVEQPTEEATLDDDLPSGWTEVEDESTGETVRVKLCSHGKLPNKCKYLH